MARWSVIINYSPAGILETGVQAACTLYDQEYRVWRSIYTIPNWGRDLSYQVWAPNGVTASGSLSQHDGFGVTSAGLSFPVSYVDTHHYRVGSEIDLVRDLDAQTISLVFPVELLVVAVCGALLVFDED